MVLLGKYIPNALNNADPDPAFPPNVREGRNVGRKRGRTKLITRLFITVKVANNFNALQKLLYKLE